MKVKYRFEMIKNGSISEGYIHIPIANHVAEIDPDNADEESLARSMDGQPQPVIEKKSSKKAQVK